MADALHIVCPHCGGINRVPREGGKCGSCHRPLFEKHPAAVNSAARFDKHAQRSDIPLLVDFWASWCGPWDDGADLRTGGTQLEPDVRLIKGDSNAVPELLQRYSIQSTDVDARAPGPGDCTPVGSYALGPASGMDPRTRRRR